MTSDQKTSVELSHAELSVLFHLLGRWVEDRQLKDVRPLVEHEAELWALNDLFCLLETHIVPGMAGGPQAARDQIMERHGDLPWPQD